MEVWGNNRSTSLKKKSQAWAKTNTLLVTPAFLILKLGRYVATLSNCGNFLESLFVPNRISKEDGGQGRKTLLGMVKTKQDMWIIRSQMLHMDKKKMSVHACSSETRRRWVEKNTIFCLRYSPISWRNPSQYRFKQKFKPIRDNTICCDALDDRYFFLEKKNHLGAESFLQRKKEES